MKKSKVVRIDPRDYDKYIKPFKADIYQRVGVKLSDSKALKALLRKIKKGVK